MTPEQKKIFNSLITRKSNSMDKVKEKMKKEDSILFGDWILNKMKSYLLEVGFNYWNYYGTEDEQIAKIDTKELYQIYEEEKEMLKKFYNK